MPATYDVRVFTAQWCPRCSHVVAGPFVQLEEDDSPWDFDTLLQSVTQEFNAEKRLTLNANREAGSDPSSIALKEGGSGSQTQSGHRSSRGVVA